MNKFIFGVIIIGIVGFYNNFTIGENLFSLSKIMPISIPYKYDITFINDNLEYIPTTNTKYKLGQIIAEYVYPRSDGFASFLEGSCTDYVARQKPELFLNEDGTRRITGNAEDWLINAKKMSLNTGTIPKKGSIAIYYNGRGGREYGHVAYVEEIQENGIIIVSEMNYKEEYIVTLRAVDAKLAAGYIY